MTARMYRITLPCYAANEDGTPNPDRSTDWDYFTRAACGWFGGCTLGPVSAGFWTYEGRMIEESVRVLSVAVTPASDAPTAHEFAEWAGEILAQQTVMVETPDGAVSFVECAR